MRLKESIDAQTSQPDEIVLVVSGALNQNGCEKMSKEMEELKIDENIWRVFCFPGKFYAGSARNIAIRRAQSDIVSFIDADDTMLPERIGVVRAFFENSPKLQFFAHGFQGSLSDFKQGEGNYKYENILKDHFEKHKMVTIERNSNGIYNSPILVADAELFKMVENHTNKLAKTDPKEMGNKAVDFGMHHAHVSVDRKLALKHPFSDFGGRSEDSLFVRGIIVELGLNTKADSSTNSIKDSSMIFARVPLSTYMSRADAESSRDRFIWDSIKKLISR